MDETCVGHWDRALREEVLLLRESHRRRVFAPALCVGRLAAHRVRLEIDAPTDAAMRADGVGALIDRWATEQSSADGVGALIDRWATERGTRATPQVWVTRPGPAGVAGDLDVDWLASARSATAELRLDLTFLVVTRDGWFDPRSGFCRQWRRLRRHRPA
ncbi:MAG: hypothetical protein ACRCYQ_02300 [Nocardioides sp.]